MLKIDRKNKALQRLSVKPMPDAELSERHDIQQWIKNSPGDFFAEMSEHLLLVGEELRPSEIVDDRIDLLAIDSDGAAVVMEIKRGTHKLHLLQALGYAAMIAQWEPARLVAERARLVGRTVDEVQGEVDEFLNEDISVNQSQRVVLLAEDFDYEVLVTAEWLSEKYDLDIRCYRLGLSADHEAEYLTCVCIYPPPEISQAAIRRRKTSARPLRWADWGDALKNVENAAVAAFFRRALSAGWETYLRKRIVRYRIQGKRRFSVAARPTKAYVWQIGRFLNDEKFWASSLGADIDIKPVRAQRALRFYLSTERHFVGFEAALKADSSQMDFTEEDVDDAAEV